ncbi:MAG: hypothetical protein HY812_18780 [Planctomycetes bacterium]|nr:hypothetical protein [Planctomycetota bacterium]
MMRKGSSLLLASVLFCGCAAAPVETTAQPPAGDEAAETTITTKLLHWPSNLALDLYDVFSMNFGMGKCDYKFGMHMQFTKAFRVGMFELADLELFGLKHVFAEEGNFYKFDQAAGDYRLAMQFGMGAGAAFALDLYEMYDWMAGVVTLNLFNPSADH